MILNGAKNVNLCDGLRLMINIRQRRKILRLYADVDYCSFISPSFAR